jgi:hypothetical protein
MNWKSLLFITLLAYGAYQVFGPSSTTKIVHGPGVTAPQTPIQHKSGDTEQIEINGYSIQPLESFTIQARVLSTKHYHFDRGAEIAPVDLAVGWGPMSDESVLSKLRISQSNRWYHWQTDDFPIPRREIEVNSANMHMIPANEEIEEKLKAVQEGQIVRINGYLVNVEAEDGWRWSSSLSREDTGAGACELVWVESVSIL